MLIFLPVLAYATGDPDEVTGRLYIEPGVENYLYIEEYDLKLVGSDKGDVTYFFLPSHADLTDIDMSGSPGSILLDDGTALSEPELGIVQSVTVEDGKGSVIPWGICFMKSDRIHSVFLDFQDIDPSDVSREDYSRVSVKVFSPTGTVETLDDAYIKGRGNATWDLGGYSPEKLPYDLKFNEPHGIGNVSPRKKWTLLANAYEGTGLLNKMVFDTAAKLDMSYVTESDWADLYANGRYLGNYLICSEPQNSAKALINAGGCLIEKNDVYFDRKPCGFRTANDAFTIKAPWPIQNKTLTGIEKLTDTVDNELSLTVPETKHIDMTSFVKWFLLEEFFYNEDALITSCYFYSFKDQKKLFAGPPWDFDGTCGESSGSYLNFTDSILNEPDSRNPLEWYNMLYDNSPEFRSSLRQYCNDYKEVFQNLLLSDIDGYYDVISSSMKMDHTLYGRGNLGFDYTTPGYYDDVSNNIRFTKYYLYNRSLYLSDIWDVDFGIPEQNFSDGSTHTVSFQYPDDTVITKDVADGAFFTEHDPPERDAENIERWIYAANDCTVSPYLPIYEDVTIRPVYRDEEQD